VTRVRAVFTAEGWAADAAELAATRVVAEWRGLQFALLCGMRPALLTAAYERSIDELLEKAS
jgi:hypothetical protein